VGPGAAGDDPRQGCFAHARRPVQDQVADAVGGDGPAQQAPGAQDPLLTDKVVEAARPHPIGQGGHSGEQGLAMVLKEIAHNARLSPIHLIMNSPPLLGSFYLPTTRRAARCDNSDTTMASRRERMRFCVGPRLVSAANGACGGVAAGGWLSQPW